MPRNHSTALLLRTSLSSHHIHPLYSLHTVSRKRKPLPLIEHVTITDIAAEGKAIARIDGMAVFVPYVIPGDVVTLSPACAALPRFANSNQAPPRRTGQGSLAISFYFTLPQGQPVDLRVGNKG